MDCGAVRELEAAFALDALNTEERAAVLEHLQGCDQHLAIEELRAVAMGLSLSVEEQTPPRRLREQVLASAGAQGPRAKETKAQPVRWRPTLAVAAVLCVVLAGAAIAMIVANGDGGERYVREFQTVSGITVDVEADFREAFVRASFAGLGPLDPGEEYQLWAVRGEDWLSLGRFRPNAEGSWSGTFAFQLQETDALCLSIRGTESASGPFGEIVFMEPLKEG